MTAQELWKAGKLEDAIAALGAHLRDNPGDAKSSLEMLVGLDDEGPIACFLMLT